MFGYGEILLILLLVLLIFGGKKIPEVARGLGKGLREFHKAKNEVTESLNKTLEEEPKDAENAKMKKTDEEKDKPA